MKNTISSPTALQLSPKEAAFLQISKLVGMTGLLLLRRMAYLGTIFTTSEENLARHTGCSVSTVKRYMNKLKALGMVEVFQQGRSPGGTWLPNKYRLRPPAFEYLAHFPPQLTHDSQTSKTEKETCRPPLTHGGYLSPRLKYPYGGEHVKIVDGREYVFMVRKGGSPLLFNHSH